MSLRIITNPVQIRQWITERHGTPARKPGSATDFRVLFDREGGDYEPVDVSDLIEAMKFHSLVMLVDQEPGKNFHKIYAHS